MPSNCCWQYASIFTQFILVGSVELFLFLQKWCFGRSRSFKVIDFGTNRKRIWDFQLVHHSNLGPILHRFKDIAGFLCSWPHPYFGVFLLDQIAYVGVSPSRSLKLISHEIIFEVFQQSNLYENYTRM